MHAKVIIVGSGPAAHTAAIYAGRAFLKPLMFEGFMVNGILPSGGALMQTTEIENFPGFPDGIEGPELMDRMRQQSINCGAEIITETVDKVDFSQKPFLIGTEDGENYTCDAVIIATGATAKRLYLPLEDVFWQKGVSACAVCDGPAPIFREKPIVVIGGGDSASEEANFLSKYGSVVYVLVRKSELRASAVMKKRMLNNDKIVVKFNTVAVSLKGGNNLEKVVVKNLITGELEELAANGLFYAIGHTPNTEIFKNQIDLDEVGYIKTEKGSTKTNVPGVFAAGDVQDPHYRQAITAAGSGCQASMQLENYLVTGE